MYLYAPNTNSDVMLNCVIACWPSVSHISCCCHIYGTEMQTLEEKRHSKDTGNVSVFVTADLKVASRWDAS
jgi:hypothetical protein